MLVIVIGTGEFRKQQPNPMYFRSIETCNWYASQVVKQYGNYLYNSYVDPKDRVTAYCKVQYVDPNRIKIYDW